MRSLMKLPFLLLLGWICISIWHCFPRAWRTLIFLVVLICWYWIPVSFAYLKNSCFFFFVFKNVFLLGIEFCTQMGTFFFQCFKYLIQCLLAFTISDEESNIILIFLSLCVMCVFFSSLFVLKIEKKILALSNLIMTWLCICMSSCFFCFIFVELLWSVGL